jgi:hypothetical protein
MNSEELTEKLSKHLELMQIDCDADNFGENLDSLDRLEILEFLISHTGKDLDFLIVESDAWKTLKSLIDEIVGCG